MTAWAMWRRGEVAAYWHACACAAAWWRGLTCMCEPHSGHFSQGADTRAATNLPPGRPCPGSPPMGCTKWAGQRVHCVAPRAARQCVLPPAARACGRTCST